MSQTNTEVTQTEQTLEATTTPDSADSAEKASDGRGDVTVITPRTQTKRNKERWLYAFLALCGLVTLASVYHSYGTGSRTDSPVSTILNTGPSEQQSSQRRVKLVDASRCRKDQIRIVADNTLVTDSDCTFIIYDDGK
jgi:hypothetical protein